MATEKQIIKFETESGLPTLAAALIRCCRSEGVDQHAIVAFIMGMKGRPEQWIDEESEVVMAEILQDGKKPKDTAREINDFVGRNKIGGRSDISEKLKRLAVHSLAAELASHGHTDNR